MSGGPTAVADRLQWVLHGSEQPRLRATWRVLLAVSLLPLVGLVLTLVMGVMGLAGMIVGGPLQAAIFLIVLAGWAWAIDRRPLTDYGLSLSRSGLGDLLAGAGAVVVGHLVWYSLGLAGGWTAIEPAVSASQNLVALGVVSAVLSFGLNVWVQDTVYFAVVLRNAAEGFRSRGVVPGRAALGGLVVGVVVFTAIHNIETAVELTDKLLAGTLFGLLYLATGRLALTIGVHGGMAATTGVLFRTGPTVEGGPSIVAVTETLPGLLGTVSARRMPQLVVAALLLAGYLQWRHGSLSIDTTVTEWVERGGGIIGSSSVPQRD